MEKEVRTKCKMAVGRGRRHLEFPLITAISQLFDHSLSKLILVSIEHISAIRNGEATTLWIAAFAIFDFEKQPSFLDPDTDIHQK